MGRRGGRTTKRLSVCCALVMATLRLDACVVTGSIPCQIEVRDSISRHSAEYRQVLGLDGDCERSALVRLSRLAFRPRVIAAAEENCLTAPAREGVLRRRSCEVK